MTVQTMPNRLSGKLIQLGTFAYPIYYYHGVDRDLLIEGGCGASGNLAVEQLENAGFEVQWRLDGKQAWEAFRAQKPDLVILDVMMPELTGFEVLERIRAEQESDLIPVIMLSARGQESDVKKGMGLGATEYVVKPFRPAELLACVQRLLSG